MKIKKLLSGILAATVALTSLSVSAITSSAADISGKITITAGSISKKTADVSINGAGSYSATIEFGSSEDTLREVGFFTYSPYPVEDDFPFTVVVDSVTISGKINDSGDTYQWKFTNFLDSEFLVPASE